MIVSIFFKEPRDTELIREKNILWKEKPIKEGSVLLWDLENIPFHRLEDIKQVAKYTPEELFIISKQHLGEKLLKKIHRENFKILNAHIGISDSKIIAIMKFYRDRENMMLISSDSDFAREATSYLKKGKLQWIVVDNVKKGVMMRVNLASKNLTLSSLAYKPSKQSASQKSYYKTAHKKALKGHDFDNLISNTKKRFAKIYKKDSQIKIYFDYYREEITRVLKRVKKLYKKVRYNLKQPYIKDESQTTVSVEINNPIEGKRDIYRRNSRGKRVRAGTLQFRKDRESVLLLYKNLLKKYEVPAFAKHIFFKDFEEIEIYIHFNTREQEYYINDFIRKSYDEII